MAQEVGIRELLEAGVHFGHQTRRWNPKMRRFIYGERGGIYIIDLLRTEALLGQAQRFADGLARRGGTVLFVGTKKQARDGIKEIAEAAGQPYVNHRWLGGLLTNFQTISARIKRLHDLERYESEGQLGLLPTRERMAAQADLEKLRANLGGVKNMQRVPDALFVIDLKTEAIAVREAQRLRIPIIGLVDTNCDPDGIDYVIPGNDDGIRACNIVTRAIGDVIATGNRTFREEEERARRRPPSRRAARPRRRPAARPRSRRARRPRRPPRPRRSTHGGEGEPRDVAEATVAEAVADLGRPQAEGRRAAEAGAAAQAADEPAMPATGNVGPGQREQRHDPNVGDRVPQEAGAAAGAGAPSSEAAAAPAEEPPATRARGRARKREAVRDARRRSRARARPPRRRRPRRRPPRRRPPRRRPPSAAGRGAAPPRRRPPRRRRRGAGRRGAAAEAPAAEAAARRGAGRRGAAPRRRRPPRLRPPRRSAAERRDAKPRRRSRSRSAKPKPKRAPKPRAKQAASAAPSEETATAAAAAEAAPTEDAPAAPDDSPAAAGAVENTEDQEKDEK